MNEITLQRLEYFKIKQYVMDYAVSYLGKEHVANMQPMIQYKAVRTALDETEEALAILRGGANVPVPSLRGIDTVLNLLGTGYVFGEQDFSDIHMFLHSSSQLKTYMESKTAIAPRVARFALSIYEMPKLKTEIERCLRNGRITDNASKDLSKIRKKIDVVEERIKTKINALMTRHRSILQEHLVSQRGDRYVLPIKKEHRKLITGAVLDESSSGQTVYIEPAEIAHLQHELAGLRADEAREEAKVLGYLTGLVEESEHELRVNVETAGVYDFLFAKAKYALAIGGRGVALNDRGFVDIRVAKHPLLGSETVPLNFSIGSQYKALIITGPNTGGKTVALKTVGLLTLMVQSGLLVPAGENSEFAVFRNVAADIGDGQSIEQSLSTFSAHIKNVIDILRYADTSTLVLIDEMASGTDPGEGVGLSIAILEELHRRGTTVVATTHFNEIKHFAAMTPGFQNARMEFDADTLRPLYRLRIGEAGRSYAFQIALNLGMSPDIIRRSEEITAGMRRGNSTERAETFGNPVERHTEEPGTFAEIDDCDTEGAGIAPTGERRTEEANAPAGSSERFTGEVDSIAISSENRIAPKGKGGAPLARPEEESGEAAPGKFAVGDSVYVSYLKRTGIVFQEEDARGNVGVMIQKQKVYINKKRLTLHIAKEHLYPENYDFDIVFETKENRKKKKLMGRKHVEGLVIIREPEEPDKL